MDKLIATHDNFSIWQLSENGLSDLAMFVVKENYKHHQNYDCTELTITQKEELEDVLKEERSYYENSKIFVAKNDKNKIIGAIRLMQWNKTDELPITKLFGINPLSKGEHKTSSNIWHIGRFAVESGGTNSTRMNLFRVLMMYAVAPICKYQDGLMYAECDSKLLRAINGLGLEARTLDEGIEYLGSKTIPICIGRNGMLEFMSRHCSLALNINSSFTYCRG